jgi:hypothetical protein
MLGTMLNTMWVNEIYPCYDINATNSAYVVLTQPVPSPDKGGGVVLGLARQELF